MSTVDHNYRPHPKDGEGNVFSLSTPLGGGVPISHNALQHFPECHGAAEGGYPSRSSRGGGYPARSSQGGGVPCQGVPWGVPCQGGTLAGGYPAGGYPARGDTQVGYPPGQVRRGGTQLGQQKEYSLHGGRYASCVHAGGLSC